MVNRMKGQHYIIHCSCGSVMNQYRCPGPRMEQLIEAGYPACLSEKRCDAKSHRGGYAGMEQE